nr:hypothetical protein [Agrobacterium vitis]
MGTALFAKVYRIVTKWYGNPTNKDVLPQVLDDAIMAWETGYFEGVAVFRAEDLWPSDLRWRIRAWCRDRIANAGQ